MKQKTPAHASDLPRRILIIVTLFPFSVLSTGAAAQFGQLDRDDTVELSPMVVTGTGIAWESSTATRTDTPIFDTPVASSQGVVLILVNGWMQERGNRSD